MEEGITREAYVRGKLSKEIGELKDHIAELEFAILLLREENERIKRCTDGEGNG